MNRSRPEKLKAVFKLGAVPGGEMKIGKAAVRQLVKTDGIGDAHALGLVISTMDRLGIRSEFKRNDGTIVAASEFAKKVASENKWGTSVEAGGLIFSFGNVTTMHQSFVQIEEKIAGASRSWDEWISPFLNEPHFVQAWISDVSYDRWQNATDPLEYEASGRDYKHLPMKSNGLPFPLEKKIVDTSNNPGRWLMRDGYVEVVSAQMWLSETFFELVKTIHREQVDAVEWLDVKEVRPGIIQIKVPEGSFIDNTSVQIQAKMRSLFYDS